MLVFLVLYMVLLAILCRVYLFPALQTSQTASPGARRIMSMHALLLMIIMLLILLIGLLMTFRMGGLFRPRQTSPRKPTQYIDAWEESARRLQLPKDDEPHG